MIRSTLIFGAITAVVVGALDMAWNWYTFDRPVIISKDVFAADQRPILEHGFRQRCQSQACYFIAQAGETVPVIFPFRKIRDCKAIFPFFMHFSSSLGHVYKSEVQGIAGRLPKGAFKWAERTDDKSKAWHWTVISDSIPRGTYTVTYVMAHDCNSQWFGYPWRGPVTSTSTSINVWVSGESAK